MRARPLLRTIRLRPADPSLLRGLLLALFFLAGALAGHLCARSWDTSAQNALTGYLTDYCAVYDAGGVSASLGSCVLLYFGYTVLTFLLGFASVGVALIPALAGLYGFLTMYTVSGFVCCFGGRCWYACFLHSPAFLPWLVLHGPSLRSWRCSHLAEAGGPLRFSTGAGTLFCLCCVWLFLLSAYFVKGF